LSFPALGSQSAAYQASGTVSGLTIGVDLVLALKGTQVAVMAYGDVGTPNITQVVALATKAVAKIPA